MKRLAACAAVLLVSGCQTWGPTWSEVTGVRYNDITSMTDGPVVDQPGRRHHAGGAAGGDQGHARHAQAGPAGDSAGADCRGQRSSTSRRPKSTSSRACATTSMRALRRRPARRGGLHRLRGKNRGLPGHAQGRLSQGGCGNGRRRDRRSRRASRRRLQRAQPERRHRLRVALERERRRAVRRRHDSSSAARMRRSIRICPPSRLAAQPRGEIDDAADRRVVEAALEAERAERREALRDADAEVEVVAQLAASASRSGAKRACIASAIARGALAAAPATGSGSLKKIRMPSPAKRSSVPSCAATSAPIAA